MSSIRITIVAASFALAAVAAAPIASAKDRLGVSVNGVCSQSSTSTLKLSREDRGIEVEFQVDQNRSDVPWNVTLRRNGALVTSLTAITRSPSGSFSVRRVIAKGLATDRITAIATRASGEECTGTSLLSTSSSIAAESGRAQRATTTPSYYGVAGAHR